MSSLNILVLGSEGAIGSHLVDIIPVTLRGATVIRVSRKKAFSDLHPSSGILLNGDLLDTSFVKAIFEKHDIHVIIFCAAKWNGLNQDPTVLDDNVTMFNNVLSSLPKSVSNFIYLSSSAVYTPPNADDALSIETLPNSTYGKSKLINEILLLNKAELSNIVVSIYRPFHIVSPYEIYYPGHSHITTDFVHRYIELDIDFNWSELSDDVFIPFYWVDDLCSIILDNLFNKAFAGKIFNVGASQSFSILSLALCVATVAKKYGLSSKELPVYKAYLAPFENGMKSGLTGVSVNVKDRSLLEIVERFITKRYGLIYEC